MVDCCARGTAPFTIALIIVAIYITASRHLAALARHPFIWGPVYGVVAYLVMNLVVIPLSAASPGPRVLPVVINGIMIHILGVGLPAALFARAASFGSNALKSVGSKRP